MINLPAVVTLFVDVFVEVSKEWIVPKVVRFEDLNDAQNEPVVRNLKAEGHIITWAREGPLPQLKRGGWSPVVERDATGRPIIFTDHLEEAVLIHRPPAAASVAADYNFTADWFSHNAPVLREIIRRLKPKRVLEIGSYEGRSASFFIEECTQLTEIVCIDQWDDSAGAASGIGSPRNDWAGVEHRFDTNVVAAQQRRAPAAILARKLKSSSTRALAELLSRKRVAV
jgi:hypothetical protein